MDEGITRLQAKRRCWSAQVIVGAGRYPHGKTNIHDCRTAGRATTSSSDPFTTPMTRRRAWRKQWRVRRRRCRQNGAAGRRRGYPGIDSRPATMCGLAGCALASAVTRAMGSCRSRMPSLIRLALGAFGWRPCPVRCGGDWRSRALTATPLKGVRTACPASFAGRSRPRGRARHHRSISQAARRRGDVGRGGAPGSRTSGARHAITIISYERCPPSLPFSLYKARASHLTNCCNKPAKASERVQDLFAAPQSTHAGRYEAALVQRQRMRERSGATLNCTASSPWHSRRS